MYALEVETLLECGLRDCGKIVGESDRFHTAAIECSHTNLGDVVGHGEGGDAAVAEGIFANRLDGGGEGVIAILSERKPHYLGCIGIEEYPVDALEIHIGCRHLDGGKRGASVGLSYRRGIGRDGDGGKAGAVLEGLFVNPLCREWEHNGLQFCKVFEHTISNDVILDSP